MLAIRARGREEKMSICNSLDLGVNKMLKAPARQEGVELKSEDVPWTYQGGREETQQECWCLGRVKGKVWNWWKRGIWAAPKQKEEQCTEVGKLGRNVKKRIMKPFELRHLTVRTSFTLKMLEKPI